MASEEQTKQKQNQGFFGNLAFNIIIPVVVMSYGSAPEYLGPAWSIVAALVFPIGYGIWDLKQSGKVNGFSILGIVSVLLTGGISLLKLPAEYIAIKEAAIPALIGLAVLATQYTKKPLVRMLILNDNIINWPALNNALDKKNKQPEFRRKVANSSYIVATSFFVSSVLNYVLAKMILVSEPGTTAYTEELGRMTALSYPVIVIPSTILLVAALWYLFSQISKITGEDLDNFLNN
ncbi:VC0807 family protein [Alteromonas lipotrueiana]|uniref:VC0807 family protein n=1 Tax=Alteromonas lipotrueiana TaxID=2803815 RepID=UPI001FE75959|nr:VC0807 family protein [Alteromonas lipotrueiana]|tara:strand:- start:40 stop:744 length:705 start_codon:yes stop_codon:yes gene_type:complete